MMSSSGVVGSLQTQVRTSDMSEDLRAEALSKAVEVMQKHSGDYEAAAKLLKQHFDATHKPPSWQCVVGTRFGSKVTHQDGTLIYFKVGRYHEIVLYRAKQ